jgi:hypothetical protein
MLTVMGVSTSDGCAKWLKTLTFIPLPYLTDHSDQMQEIPRETHSQGLTAQLRINVLLLPRERPNQSAIP